MSCVDRGATPNAATGLIGQSEVISQVGGARSSRRAGRGAWSKPAPMCRTPSGRHAYVATVQNMSVEEAGDSRAQDGRGAGMFLYSEGFAPLSLSSSNTVKSKLLPVVQSHQWPLNNNALIPLPYILAKAESLTKQTIVWFYHNCYPTFHFATLTPTSSTCLHFILESPSIRITCKLLAPLHYRFSPLLSIGDHRPILSAIDEQSRRLMQCPQQSDC